jgi:hypothetical protein
MGWCGTRHLRSTTRDDNQRITSGSIDHGGGGGKEINFYLMNLD